MQIVTNVTHEVTNDILINDCNSDRMISYQTDKKCHAQGTFK